MSQIDEEKMEKNLDDNQCISCGTKKLSGSDYCQSCEYLIENLARDNDYFDSDYRE